MNDARKKRVLVTGSSRGIGRATALRLAADGFQVTLHCQQRMDALREVARQLSEDQEDTELLQFDIADRAAAQAALTQSVDRFGPFYGVICCAGIARDLPFPALEGGDWDRVIDTNLNGFYNVLHPLVMPMIHLRDGGRIVTLSSVSGIAGNRGQVNYSAAKAGIIGATKALSRELAKRRIAVNCVAPGIIETEMTAGIPPAIIEESVPMRRAGKAEEVAALIAFLCSDLAEYITGQVVSINGGML